MSLVEVTHPPGRPAGDPRRAGRPQAVQTTGRVAIIIVNWNGWADTIECLESVFRSDYPDYHVIVCDNGSTNGSLEYIEAWATGRLDTAVSPQHPLRSLSFPGVAKPLAYRRCHAEVAAGGVDDTSDRATRLILIRTDTNRGFAAGVNVGLRYALARWPIEYVWLLNNDAVVHPAALGHLVRRLHACPDAGMCGSTVRYYDEPAMVQSLGGATYNRWVGATWHLGLGQSSDQEVNVDTIQRALTYIHGASMLVSRSFLEDVGLMNEDYFLYFEELDWAIRGRGRYALAYAPDSLVFHKEGASGGTSPNAYRRSLLAEYFHVRNRVRLTRRFFPLALPTVYLAVAFSLVKRISEGQWDKARVVMDAALGVGRPPTMMP